MDNNNPNGGMNGSQNMSPNMPPNMQQNMPNMQSGMQGAPNTGAQMGPNMQMGPMGPNMGPANQNMGPMNPNMGQPYPQQAMRPPKQPMDPAKKKLIIIIVSVVSGLVVIGIVLAIILPMVLRVDYATAYNTAKELKPKIYDIYQSYDCEYVVDEVDYSWVSAKTYDEYVEECKKIYNAGTDDLVNQLENTDGVKRNEEIRAQFEKFKNEYTKLSSGSASDLDNKLKLWQARHNFVVAVDDLTDGSTDAEFTTAANYLINSGNDALKTYGEGWLEWRLALATAYRAYDNASWSDYSAYRALRDAYYNKDAEFDDWLAENKPDINEVAPLNFSDTYDMYEEFSDLYDLITETYELNYNTGSGDCTEIFGEVYCD